MKTWKLKLTLVATIVVALGVVALLLLNDSPPTVNSAPLHYTFEVTHAFPHDANAFTQGLEFKDGIMYEGTGLNGSSTLRKVELETGKVLQSYSLPEDFFGEGITVFDDRIIQLTWQSQKGFVYNKNFELLKEFTYQGEGWGITHDGIRLIMSNGSATLSFLDPVTFEIVGYVQVHDDKGDVINLNELEFIDGDIYANIWEENRIAIINPQTGQVKGWINLTGLYSPQTFDPNNVLNGIAYDAQENRLFVTGKRWPKLFEVKIILTE